VSSVSTIAEVFGALRLTNYHQLPRNMSFVHTT
jgi:hypothetical protein